MSNPSSKPSPAPLPVATPLSAGRDAQRSLSRLLWALCALYLAHLAFEMTSALDPLIESKGLMRSYPPPRALSLTHTLLTPLSGDTLSELKRRYLQPHELIAPSLSASAQTLNATLNATLKASLEAPHATLSLPELHTLLTRTHGEPTLERLSAESPLPLVISAPTPSPLSPPSTAHQPRSPSTHLYLIIARYAGEWVWFEPELGVVLGPLPDGWLDAQALHSPLLQERRW